MDNMGRLLKARATYYYYYYFIFIINCNWFVTRWQLKLVTTEFKSGGLHEKHVMVTWNVGNQGNQEKPVSRWPVCLVCIYLFNNKICKLDYNVLNEQSRNSNFKCSYTR